MKVQLLKRVCTFIGAEIFPKRAVNKVSVLNKSRDECIMDIWVNWMLQNCIHAFVQPHADALTRPAQSTALSQHVQEYSSKITYIAPADVQLGGKEALPVSSASWRADPSKQPDPVCLKRCPGYRHTSREDLGLEETASSQRHRELMQPVELGVAVRVRTVCRSSLPLPAPVLCLLSTTCLLPQQNHPAWRYGVGQAKLFGNTAKELTEEKSL